MWRHLPVYLVPAVWVPYPSRGPLASRKNFPVWLLVDCFAVMSERYYYLEGVNYR
jgi:hypothetical protein